MVVAILKYTYLIIAYPVAILLDRMPVSARERRERGGWEGREPVEAAEYRAEQLTQQPLRTVGLLILYQIVFTGAALCGLAPDTASTLFFPLGFVGVSVQSIIPAVLIPILPVIGAVAGLVWALIIHQALLAVTEIRMAMG